MDQIEKFLRKLDRETTLRLAKALEDIKALQLRGYDVEKMKGFSKLYRIRIGKIRIIFEKDLLERKIIAIDYRGDVYKNL